MENLYVHSVNKKEEIPVTGYGFENFHCTELRQLVESSFTREELVKLNSTMESPNGALDVLQRSFDTIINPIKKMLHSFITKNDKFEKDVLDSKGDISKIKPFETTLKILHLLSKDKDKYISRRAEQVIRLYNMIYHMKSSFMAGYQIRSKLNGSFVWGTYTLEVNYIAACTTHLVAIHSNIMKSESYVLSQLDKSIQNFSNGNMQKWCDFFLKTKKEESTVKESGILVVTALLIGTLITVGFFLRVLVFYFYYCRMQLSDYFNQQADYFNLHASELKKSGLDSSQKDAVIKAQKVWADRFAQLSDAVIVDDLKAGRKANDIIKVSNKEVKSSNIDVPNVGMDFI